MAKERYCSAGPARAGPGRAGTSGEVSEPLRRGGAERSRAGLPARAQQSGGGGSGSASAAREENPARLIPLAAQNVNCQRFSTVALLLCGDSAGQMERIRSALRVRECQLPAFLRGRPSVVW
ncbi:uncharacterized protein FN964_005011 [Alca torda]